jgi:PiT family inorganic phosphate transporter
MIYPLVIIFLALLFDFYNGMNDAANSIATVVSTRVLRPLQAVAWAAFFNFIAAFIFGTDVAKTIGRGIITSEIIDYNVIFSALIGGIIVSSVCTHLGLPISVSHSIIGGLCGATLVKIGITGIIFSGFFKVIVFIFFAPILGMSIAFLFSICTLWIVKNMAPRKVDKYFRKLR